MSKHTDVEPVAPLEKVLEKWDTLTTDQRILALLEASSRRAEAAKRPANDRP